MLKPATKFKPSAPAFEDACRAGFRWAELWLGPDVLAGWQDVVPLARSADDNPGLALDVEHLWKYTLRDAPLPRLLDEVRRLLDLAGDRLRHVHLPGYLPGQPEHRPLYRAPDMAFPVLSLLREAGFG